MNHRAVIVAIALLLSGCGLWWEKVEHRGDGSTVSTPGPLQRAWWSVSRATYDANSAVREGVLCRLFGHDWQVYPAGWETSGGRYRTATVRVCDLGGHFDPLVWSAWKSNERLPAVTWPNGMVYREIISPDGRMQ